MRLGDLLGVLRDAYCRTIGVEYMHIQNTDEQIWIQNKVEARQQAPTKEQKDRILERLNAAESFEKFLATKYVGTKRFGIEGAESAIPILDEILSNAADASFDGVALGMAHRGRLNVLSNIMGKSYEAIFSEFEGHVDPTTVQGSGDVKYHLGMKGKYVSPSGADDRGRTGRQPEPPRDRRSDRARHGPRPAGPDRAGRWIHRAAGAHPRRCRLRRPGHRRRGAGDERHRRVPHRRHHPSDHQQPDRLHDRAAVRPLVAVLLRRRQDRSRRRSSTSTATTPRPA